MNDLSNFFKILSDETRLRILILLYHKKLCVCEIYGIMNESQPKISKHLAKLRDIGLIKDERQEQYIFYSLSIDEEIYMNILKNIIDNIDNFPVLKNDFDNSKDVEKYLKYCKLS